MLTSDEENMSLEDMINDYSRRNYGNSYNKDEGSIYGRPTQRPNIEESLSLLKRKAIEEDDFHRILDYFKGIAQQAHQWGMWSAAETVLRETHTEYVRTQKTLAEACAEAGDFEEMEKH